MPYDKSEGSLRYNKEERGGWYCTNPKKHDEGQMHHSAEEPHMHRAERNEEKPVRQKPQPVRPKPQPSAPKLPDTSQATKNKRGLCGCFFFMMFLPFLFAIIATLADGSSDDYDNDYYESYEDDIDSTEPDYEADTIAIDSDTTTLL